MRDQTSTLHTLDRLQEFIDDYPKSKNISNVEIFIEDLRNRLARKQHQTGCLYMKIGEYDSALLYFNDTIDNYYDTIYSDKARISIIQSYLFKNEVSKAKAMLEIYKGEFRNSQYFSESQSIINDYNKKPSISDYLDLYINSSKADESQNKRDLIVENISLEELGNSALYFVSDLSKSVTGEIHYVDCGFNIKGMPTKINF